MEMYGKIFNGWKSGTIVAYCLFAFNGVTMFVLHHKFVLMFVLDMVYMMLLLLFYLIS